MFAQIGQIYGDKLGDHERAMQYYESALDRRSRVLAGQPRAVRALLRARRVAARAADRRHPHAEGHARGRSGRALRVLSQARRRRREDRRPARRGREPGRGARDPAREHRRARAARQPRAGRRPRPTTSSPPSASWRSSTASATPRTSLARVLVAQGSLREREYDIEAAEQIYLEAFELAPDEYDVVEALVSLHEKLRRFDAAAVVLEAFIGAPPFCDVASRRRATGWRRSSATARWIRRARPITLEELIEEDADHRDRALPAGAGALPARPLRRGAPRLRAADPARGGARRTPRRPRSWRATTTISAASPRRRATRPAPGARIAAPSISIRPIRRRRCRWRGARRRRRRSRAGAQHPRRGAARSPRRAGREVELQLRRGMARFFVAIDDRAARRRGLSPGAGARAGEPRRSRGARPSCSPSDDTLNLAREELLLVLGSDLRHAPAYRLLVSVYQRSGDLDRAARVGTMLALLGYAEATDRPPTVPCERQARFALGRAAPHASVAAAGARRLHRGARRGARDARRGLRRADGRTTPCRRRPCTIRGFKVCVVDAQRLFGVSADVYVAQQVPGGVVMFDSPQADGDHRGVVRRASRRRAALPARARVRAACAAATRW